MNPPQNPTLKSHDAVPAPSISSKKPINSDPAALTVKVPAGKPQQGLFDQPYIGYEVPRHTAQGPSDSYCHDLADHFVENAFLLKTLQIYAKFNYGS